MSDFTYQILKDTTEKAVIKLTGIFTNTTPEDNNARILASSLSGALNANATPGLLSSGGDPLDFYHLRPTRINYSVGFPDNAGVEIYFTGDTNATIAFLTKSGEIGSENLGLPAIENNADAPTGDIGIKTYGQTANSGYTIIIELRKDNAMYQRGQFDNPQAFNYPPFDVQPK